MLAYVHAVAGGVVLLLLGYVGVLGLQIRTTRRDRLALARRHARLAPVVFALTALLWLTGLVSTWQLRTDLDLAASLHFRIGTIMVVMLIGSATSARWMQRGRADLRDLHPWLGATAVLLAAGHLLAGLQITP